MEKIGEQELQAYVDGELAPGDVARVEAAIAADPLLAHRLRRERALRERLRAAFDPVLAEPVPERLQELLRGTADIRSLVHPGAGSGSTRPRRAFSLPVYALAASLLVLAASFWLRPGNQPVRLEAGQLVAGGALAQALDDALASDVDVRAPVAIGVTFRSVDGTVCRSFTQRTRPALSGLACRSNEGWNLVVLARRDGTTEGPLRQAASETAPEVQAAIDARIQDDAFDARQERAARAAGWR